MKQSLRNVAEQKVTRKKKLVKCVIFIDIINFDKLRLI